MKIQEKTNIFELLSYEFNDLKGINEAEKEVIKRMTDQNKKETDFGIYVDITNYPTLKIIDNAEKIEKTENLILVDHITYDIEDPEAYADSEANLLLSDSFEYFKYYKSKKIKDDLIRTYNRI